MKRLMIATHNPHKCAELQTLLNDAFGGSVEVLTLGQIEPTIGEIPETGTTLHANAEIKARTAHEATHLQTLADDTGLEVDFLHGAPGVYSARFAGEHCSYDDNVNKLLREMEFADERHARFLTAICYIDASGDSRFFDGEVDGRITREPHGDAGFGYDPVFAPREDPAGRTFAEMSAVEKNSLSHRARALRAFVQWCVTSGEFSD